MAPSKSIGDAYPQVVREDGTHPMETAVREVLESVRRPTEVVHFPEGSQHFHSGWSVHPETETRSFPWVAAVPGIDERRRCGTETYEATTGIYVEYRPAWPFEGYTQRIRPTEGRTGTGGCAMGNGVFVPEVGDLRDRMNGTGAYAGQRPSGKERDALVAEWKVLIDGIRREEHDRGIAELAEALGAAGIACEVRGSMLKSDGDRRPDEHKATKLNRRSTAVYVPFPEPSVSWVRYATRGTLHDVLLAEVADERGMTVDGVWEDVARRLLASMPGGFREDGVPTEQVDRVNLRRRPLGGLVPSKLSVEAGDAPSSLPPLA